MYVLTPECEVEGTAYQRNFKNETGPLAGLVKFTSYYQYVLRAEWVGEEC